MLKIKNNLDELNELTSKATQEQSKAIESVLEGNSIFLTGPGGSGKTFTVELIYKHLLNKGKRVQVTALTGCAAVLLHKLDAKTLHSWSGMPVDDNWSVDRTVDQIRRKNKKLQQLWLHTDTLVIDEISMLSGKNLNKLEKLASSLRTFINPKHLPFGGIQLVFVGDFFQLPPVNSRRDQEADFCFVSDAWKKIIRKRSQCCVLTIQQRQTEKDDPLARILGRIREGVVDEECDAILMSRLNKPIPLEITEKGLIPTKILPINRKVNEINTLHYSELDPTNEHVFFAQTKIEVGNTTISDKMVLTDNFIYENPDDPKWSQQADLSNRYESQLKLRIGTQVMVCANICVESQIVNGTRGIVIDFRKTPISTSNEICLREYPVIETIDGRQILIDEFAFPTEHPCVFRYQIPLKHAWAITVHKTQGQTIDLAEIDIGRDIFEFGQAYVSLSRVKNINGLFITKYLKSVIRAHPTVRGFYQAISKPSTTPKHQTPNNVI